MTIRLTENDGSLWVSTWEGGLLQGVIGIRKVEGGVSLHSLRNLGGPHSLVCLLRAALRTCVGRLGSPPIVLTVKEYEPDAERLKRLYKRAGAKLIIGTYRIDLK